MIIRLNGAKAQWFVATFYPLAKANGNGYWNLLLSIAVSFN